MPEKLLTIKEVSAFLVISEDKIKELVEKGELPAYKIGGQFLRFRKEQIEAIRSEILAKLGNRHPQRAPKEYLKKSENVTYLQSPVDGLLDFFYFNDFYILSGIIILAILWIIFK